MDFPMPLQTHAKDDVLQVLALLKQRLADKDPEVMAKIASSPNAPSPDAAHASLSSDVDTAISFVNAEDYQPGEAFHSRNRLAGLAQANLNATGNGQDHNSLGDALPAVVNLYGEGNPVVWAPVMIDILLDHLLPKFPFVRATDARSYIQIPDQCSIVILGDWGADNDHAQRIAGLVQARKPDFAIHLGDIYYAGNQYECERFLVNWPLQDKKNSFALNGNHEMYSRGIPYFQTVLPAFNQEASYFTLYNDAWQLHGLDTAYVPFSIDGSVPVPDKPGLWSRITSGIGHLLGHATFETEPDARLQSQWDWLVAKLTANPKKKNIFFSHNQPVSAYLPEFEAGAFLHDQFRKLQQAIPGGSDALLAWFFGHEHKCTIYADDKTDFRARLIGNGAIPHSKQALVAAAKDETNTSCTPVFTMNDHILQNDILGIANLDLAISGFAILTLDGPNATVEYINEDGSLFLKENLTGKPNEVMEWGPNYQPPANT